MKNIKLNKKVSLEGIDREKVKELFKEHNLDFNEINLYNYINAINILKSCKIK